MKNKTRRISRILPAILAVMLCVTVFPVTAIVAFPRTTTGVVFSSTPSAPGAWSEAPSTSRTWS